VEDIVKSNFGKLLIGLGIILAYTAHSQSPQYAYRPYPILLVHGFNSTVKKTWEFPHEKGEAKTQRLYTTNVTGLQADPHTLGYFHFGSTGNCVG
jgi:hypothetical protein